MLVPDKAFFWHRSLEPLLMLFLVVSTPRPERPSDLAQTRQSYWPWIGKYQASGQCKQVYARVGRGAVAIFDVESNEALHVILNEWADIIPAHFDVYPLVDTEATKRMLAAQVSARK
jgi:muconolactone delta-isomerase